MTRTTVALTLALAASTAAAQGYPTKPIRLIVGSSPGGGGDTMARLVAQPLSTSLGQQVIVDNRPGAGGNIGADIVAKAPPDGYTLLFIFSGHVVNPTLYPKLPFDTVRDFSAVTQLATNESMLVVHPSVPAKNVKELIALAKQSPGKYSIAALPSSSQHLGSELFKLQAGIDLLYVPYKGNGPALADLLGGQVQVMFNTIAITLPHVKSGKLRALAVAGAKRSRLAPDLPTVSEAGVPGFSFNGWYGIVAPSKTPRPIVNRLSEDLRRIVKTPEIVERMNATGNEPVGSTPEEFDRLIREEIPKWANVIRAAKITITQ
ncbi:MAG TPA: tripartite tricarboxylate transporter substrate binding protein [Burkholderiales bacterium]|nr:tripartite tricarboxylate transporter substrate binding protein [Burkholderiales bacterium]